MADNDLRYIYTSPSEIRDRTEKAMVEGIMAQFPMENKLFKLEASNIRAERKEFTHKEEKEAILRTKSLTYPIKGDINLIDKRTGKIVDSVKNHPLSDTFAITDKHTLLYKGNNYSVANLMQLLPGVYTRSKATGELEADINTGTGRSFSLTLDPESQLISTEIATSKIPIAPLLRDVLGISDREITKHIPADVWQKNLEETKGKEEKHINSMYTKLVSRRLQNDKASYEDKKLALREAIESSKLHPLTTEITLGKKKDNLDGDAIVSAMGNLIKVHRGERDEDRRDSLEFKRVQNLPDFIKRRFDSERSHETVSKTKSRMTFQLEKLDPDKPDLRQILPTKPFNKVMTDFIITSTLSATPEETNPIHSLENIGKVGVIAPHEAGIKSEQQAPTSTRNIDPSHLGIIDPNRTPESGSAGLDQRFAISAMRDDEGILYTKVKDKKGQLKSVSVQELMKKVVGFPHQENVKGKVQAQVRGKIQEIDRSLVDYWIPAGSSMYTFTTNMVPFLNSDSPGRLTMAGKAITQALSLKDREEPLVQTLREDGTTFIDSMGKLISTLSPDDGEVVKVTPTEIHLKTSSGLKKVDLVKNLPFNLKGFHDDEASVSVGQKVHRGDVLADNNYTKNGKFALGRNMYVGYMPYKGYNHEDGMVISRSAASKLKSLHAAKYDYSVKQNTVLNKAMFKRFFPGDFSPEQLSKLDDQGYVKKGTRLQYGDPIIAVLEKRELSDHDRTFGNLHKSLVNPYNKIVQVWDAEEIGEVVDSYTEGKNVRIMVRAEKPIEIGDKLTGLHGNKGVVSMILEDEEMPSSVENGGKPFDIMLNPASVTSRVNLGQIMETVAGKIAQKEGKPFQMTNYGGENNLAWLQRKMAKVGVSDTDTAIDPKTGKEFGKILAGPQYFLKLSKTTESNYSARNVGGYDAFKQPIKGGDEGSKGVGFMEFLGLLGSDARKNLKEIGTLKSEENTEFWDKFMRGQPLPKPQVTFATKKFFDYLRAAGVNVKVDDNKIIASPLTDRDILSMSKGEIKDALLVDAKSLAPEKGGLFDAGVTGGFKGKNWSHYTLAEPVVNPTFETPVKSVLGLSGSEFNNITSGSVQVRKKSPGIFQLIESRTGKIQREVVIASGLEKKAAIELEDVISALQSTEGKVGGAAFEEMLGDLDVGRELALTRDEFNKTKSKSKQNTLITKMKYLNGLSKQDFAQPKDAYILRNVPVLPPIMRPAIDQGGQRIEFSDVNRFYRDHIILNRSFKDVKDRLPPEMLTVERKAMYDGVKAMMGLGDAIDPQTRQRGLKGIMVQVGGETGPKQGMFQSKILSKKQDFSGRVTISASPEVGFNDAQIPKDQMWMMFKMHIIRDLVKNGYRLPEAKKAWEDRSPSAQNSFEKLRKHIPVIINRAPTLMRTNIMAVFGTPVEGKTLGLNILHLPGFAADFDGDAMSMFVPMTEEAIKEAKDKLLPMHHINDARRGFGVPMFTPGHEAILGSVHLTEPDTEQKTVAFKSEREALNALKEGKVSLNTPITITGKK